MERFTPAEFQALNNRNLRIPGIGFWARGTFNQGAIKHWWSFNKADDIFRALCGVSTKIAYKWGPWPEEPGPFCDHCEDRFFERP
jgi:hypothetical protein